MRNRHFNRLFPGKNDGLEIKSLDEILKRKALKNKASDYESESPGMLLLQKLRLHFVTEWTNQLLQAYLEKYVSSWLFMIAWIDCANTINISIKINELY